MAGKTTIAPFNALQNWEKWETAKALKPNQIAVFGVRGNKFVLLKTEDPLLAKIWASFLKLLRVIKSDTNAKQNLHHRSVAVLKTSLYSTLITPKPVSDVNQPNPPVPNPDDSLLKKTIESLIEEKNNLNNENIKLHSSSQVAIGNLEVKIKTLETEKAAWEITKGELIAETDADQKKLEVINAELDQLKKQLANEKLEQTKLEVAHKDLQSNYHALETDQEHNITQLKASIESLVATTKKHVESTDQKEQSLNKTITTLKTQLEEAQAQADQKEEAVKANNAQVAEKVKGLHKFFENDIKAKNETISSYEREVRELKKQVAIFENDNLNMTRLIDEKDKEIAEAIISIKEQLAENLKLSDTNDTLKQQLDSAESSGLKTLNDKKAAEQALAALQKELEIAKQNAEINMTDRSKAQFELTQIRNPASDQFKQHISFLSNSSIAKKLLVATRDGETPLESLLKACYKADEKVCQEIVTKAKFAGLNNSMRSSRGV